MKDKEIQDIKKSGWLKLDAATDSFYKKFSGPELPEPRIGTYWGFLKVPGKRHTHKASLVDVHFDKRFIKLKLFSAYPYETMWYRVKDIVDLNGKDVFK
jgi:hypothetical protein